MSDIFRKSMLNRLPNLPPMDPPASKAPWAMSDEEKEELRAQLAGVGVDDDEEEEMEDMDDIGELGGGSSGPSRRRGLHRQELSPISASTYFSQALEISPPSYPVSFRAYYTPSIPPPVLGSTTQDKGKQRGSLLVCHHGAGSSGTTFACLAKEVKEAGKGELGVLSFDCRGHGKTTTTPVEAEKVLSFLNLQQDFLAMITHVFPDPSECPDLLLLGHSMGASPVISSAPILQQRGYKVVGVIVLDVVEGTAVEALPLMKEILGRRPTMFKSLEDAIEWHATSGAVRNVESARVSTSAMMIPAPNANEGSKSVVWRTDLVGTSGYWEEWYSNLSSTFLSARAAKLLVLAGQERLDRELMVGQMQGKFQLEVLKDVGHYLHEDKPARLASVILEFWKRNTTKIILPPKIGARAGSGSGKGAVLKMVGEA